MTPTVAVIGAGSIGSRHARNLCRLGARVAIADSDESRARAAADTLEGARAVPLSLDDLARYDGVVIASPTSLHAAHAAAALDQGVRALVEKPLATSLEEAGVAAGSAEIMVGYNLRFHEPVRRLREMTEQGRAGRVRHARFWFGSFLPDWRPGVDYRQSYSARRELGGGVLLDAIHELDLAVWWFGTDLQAVASVVRRVGGLDIDVEDFVDAIVLSGGGVPVHIQLDYLSRGYRRGIELVGDEASVRLDWSRGGIEVDGPGGRTFTACAEGVERSYEREAAHFLSWLAGDAPAAVDGVEGAASLRLADAIRAVSR